MGTFQIFHIVQSSSFGSKRRQELHGAITKIVPSIRASFVLTSQETSLIPGRSWVGTNDCQKRDLYTMGSSHFGSSSNINTRILPLKGQQGLAWSQMAQPHEPIRLHPSSHADPKLQPLEWQTMPPGVLWTGEPRELSEFHRTLWRSVHLSHLVHH